MRSDSDNTANGGYSPGELVGCVRGQTESACNQQFDSRWPFLDPKAMESGWVELELLA